MRANIYRRFSTCYKYIMENTITNFTDRATIVTSYFKLNISKASHETYSEWMKNMLVIDNPMVIFCDESSRQFIETQREDKKEKTVIITTAFNEFHTYKYANEYIANYKVDSEQRVGHTPLLYMIWGEKSHFLKRAIEMDPFKTDYFLWVDIGCFRKPNTQYIDWPNPARISEMDKTKVLLLSVVPFTESELECGTKENLPLFQFTNRIGGTMFGGGKEVLLKWHDLYYEMVEYFISIGRFIGKDQSIMNSVYLLNRDMCDLIQWKPGCADPWFYIQDHLVRIH